MFCDKAAYILIAIVVFIMITNSRAGNFACNRANFNVTSNTKSEITIATDYVHQYRNYIERMVQKWAPLIWLAPGEKFFPIEVSEFLRYVTVRSQNEQHEDLPVGPKSEHMFLVTKSNMDDLLQNPASILYGQNPNITNVPVYAYVSECKCRPNHFHVTYWLFFPFSQGKTMCILDMGMLGPVPIPHFNDRCFGSLKEFGSHVGDWEHTSFLFKGKEEPEEMYVSAHDAGAFYKYNEAAKEFVYNRQEIRKGFIQRPTFPPIVKVHVDNKGYHPILFAAKGSHGLWTAPGKHKYVRLPRLYDISGYGIPWKTWKQTEIIHSKYKLPSWIFYRGKWGNPKDKCHPLSRMGLNICQITDGPSGILRKKSNFFCDTTVLQENVSSPPTRKFTSNYIPVLSSSKSESNRN